MSITLFCLVKGNTTANAFSVKICRDETISNLKEAIKDKVNVPANFKAKDLKLYKKEIPGDHDDQLRNLSHEDSCWQ